MTIERAAKAILAEAKWPHGLTYGRELARAALDAIAEPTPEMIEAGWACTNISRDETIILWRAMHAAMMNSRRTSAGNSREL